MCKFESQDLHTKLNRIKLSRINFHTTNCILKKVINNSEIRVDDVAEVLFFKLQSYIEGIEKEKIIVYRKYPKNWVESLKERFLPKFLLKKFPIKYEEIDINVSRFIIYPHFEYENASLHFEWIKGTQND